MVSLNIRSCRSLLWLAVFLLHALPFANRPALIGGDEPHYALMAHSIAVDHDLDLSDDYRQVEEGASRAAGKKWVGKTLDQHVVTIADKKFFSHPLGLPFLASPFLWVLNYLSRGASPDLLLGIVGLCITFAGLMAGFGLAVQFLGNRRDASIVCFSVYFSTPLWFYSRTFYTEPYIWSFAVLAIFCLTRQRWLLGSILLGATFLLKETAALIIVPIGLYIWKRSGWRRCFKFLLFPVASFVLFCLKNHLIYGRWMVTFQPFQLGNPLRGAAGLIFDLRHGLLFFAPIFVFAIMGWARKPDSRVGDPDASAYALIALLLYFVVTASWLGWEGGSCYGPRLLLPVLPGIALPVASSWSACQQRTGVRVLFYGLTVTGFAVQWCAATHPFQAAWSASILDLLGTYPLYAVAGALLGGGILTGLTQVSRPVVW